MLRKNCAEGRTTGFGFWIKGVKQMNSVFRLQFLSSASDNRKPVLSHVEVSAIENLKLVGLLAIAFTFAFGGAVAQAQQTGKIFRIGSWIQVPLPAWRSSSRRSGRRCASSDGSRERILPSSTDLQRGKMTASLSLQRSWFVLRSI